MSKIRCIYLTGIVLLLIFSLSVNTQTYADDEFDYKWDGVNGLGIPYSMELEIGDEELFAFHLKENHEYVFWLYGQYLQTDTDYDMELHDSNSLITRATAAAGLNEIIEFKPDHTDDYVVVVENDPRQSEAEYPCKLVVLEEISANKEQKVYIEGAINDDGEWDPQLNTYYAFLFDAREQTNKTFDVTLSTPKQVDMYQMRLYKRPVKEVRVGSEYDALDPFSEYALLTDDAPTVGDDLQFSFYITTQSGTEMREKSRFFSDYFIIELIGERGDGTCELLIKEVIEESAGEPENEVENPPEETPPEENTPEENAPEQSTPEEETPSSFKELTLIQKITGGGILIAFVVVCGLFVYILIKR